MLDCALNFDITAEFLAKSGGRVLGVICNNLALIKGSDVRLTQCYSMLV